ncbi:L-seryl-tRNA(Sec) selenium transferase [Leucobacter tenebrionis]|uniref:L-seryl-tRNA(Sec) selenium transferase n=1 Tax=Leucobacter tenebrionis TaxID=2873270 RepID=UPI001CA7901A|nr:L-seryl-tRNA(Sec) selenium transferase [Leucobacter tenebrionis]QZY52833.1 L-seryl-tRNA(Sec) selenium transferase [Leucobacter tenebrionis]
MSDEDHRRRIPRTDRLLALPAAREARERIGDAAVRRIIDAQQRAAREGRLPAERVEPEVERALRAERPTSLTPVLNATGVIVHTNLGRAPLARRAREAVLSAAGYVDVEMDLETGKRSARGAGAREALLQACPDAEDAVIVNNGAAALLLAVTALAGTGEIIVSRGELVEIGAGFRLPDLLVTTGARLREVGTTNRTHLDDYAQAIGPETGCLLKIHPSNFRVQGFTAEVGTSELRSLADEHGLPLIVDLGSGLLDPEPTLPDEPDIASALRAGADVVIASGDKLLGGPQAGLLLGRSAAIRRIATHPLARAMRSDKLTLAAIEATLRIAETPVSAALHADPGRLRERTLMLAERVGAEVVPHDGRVGGGGAPGVPLPGWAVELPESASERLRAGEPAVVARVHQGRCLVDLRCVAEEDDERLAEAVLAAMRDPEPRRLGLR